MTDAPHILTVFRSRLSDAAYDAGYEARADEMLARARAMPGFVEFTSYTADDGERVSVVVFATRAEHDAWARDLDHRAAQQQGRDTFYSEYRITVAEVTDERAWPPIFDPALPVDDTRTPPARASELGSQPRLRTDEGVTPPE